MGSAIARAVAVLAGVLIIVGAARPVAADAFLVSVAPGDGSLLTSAPPEVMLTFSEPVEVAADGFAVFRPNGARVDPGVLRRPRPEVVSIPLPGLQVDSRSGTYTVRWRVISADSHPVGGTVTFSISSRSGPVAASGGPTDRLVAVAYGLAGFAALAGLMVLVGAVALVLYGGPWPGVTPPIRRLVVAGWVAAVGGTLAALLLRGPYATGLGSVFDGDLLAQTLRTRYGAALALRLVVLGVVPSVLVGGARRLPAASARRLVAYRAVGLIMAAGLALTWTMTRTTTAAALVAGVAHVLAAAVWLGGLAATAVALREESATAVLPAEVPVMVGGGPAAATATSAAPADPQPVAGRFSKVTAGCVAVLALTGGYQAWQDVGGPGELLSTTYGRLLLLKILVVGALLAVTVRLRPGWILAAGSAAAVLVVALTVALAEVKPAEQAQAARPATLTTGDITVRLPNTARGVDHAELTLPNDTSAPQGSWTQPDIGVGPLPVRFTRTGTGRYRLDWPPLPVAGRWNLAITLRSATVRLSVRIR